jgi:F-type H+-transporting ATPase subunit b
MISVDFSVVIQLINFVLLIFILNLILYRPIRNILTQRKEKVIGLEHGIATCESNSKEKDMAITNGIRDARAKGLKAKEALLQQASEAEKEMVAKINLKAQENLAKVQEKIEKEVAVVRASLLKEVDIFADIIGQKVLGRTAQ